MKKMIRQCLIKISDNALLILAFYLFIKVFSVFLSFRNHPMAITGILGPISLYFIIGLVVALVSKKDPVISAAYAGLLAFILTFIIGEISFYYIGSIPLPRSHFQLAKIILNQIVSLIGAIAISSLGGKLVRKYKA